MGINGLLPLEDMKECGYIHAEGFVWLKQKKKKKKKTKRKFEKFGKLMSYATDLTAVVKPAGRIKKLITGVIKTKELLIWLSLRDIYLDDPPTGKINFQVPEGLSRSFPVSTFRGGGGERVVVLPWK